MGKAQILAQARNDFSRRYRPPETEEAYLRHDFEIFLDRLIYAAFACAQEPFVIKLNAFQDLSLRQASLMTATSKLENNE